MYLNSTHIQQQNNNNNTTTTTTYKIQQKVKQQSAEIKKRALSKETNAFSWVKGEEDVGREEEVKSTREGVYTEAAIPSLIC